MERWRAACLVIHPVTDMEVSRERRRGLAYLAFPLPRQPTSGEPEAGLRTKRGEVIELHLLGTRHIWIGELRPRQIEFLLTGHLPQVYFEGLVLAWRGRVDGPILHQ